MAGDEDFNFISTKDATKLTGYTRDYIGQLSRKGYFKSKKIGRKLFVDTEGLLAYKQLGEKAKKSYTVPEVPSVISKGNKSTANLEKGNATEVSLVSSDPNKEHVTYKVSHTASYPKPSFFTAELRRLRSYLRLLGEKRFVYVVASVMVLVIAVSFASGLKNIQFALSTFEEVKTASNGKLLAGFFDFDYKKLFFSIFKTPNLLIFFLRF